jgi:pilus assembly protein Flp/PilA
MLYLWLLAQSFLTRREEGQGLVEYALIIALVAILIIVALTALSTQIQATFSEITASL